ncbi:MAG: ABC transporter permease [Aristaeellaceae bacterium]
MKANEAAAGRARPAPSRARRFLHNVTHYRYLHLMVLPGLAFFLLFKYVPMYGIIIAFKNYKGAAGGFSAIMSAPWIGLKNFEIFFNSLYCERVFKNTIYLSILRLIFSFPAPILLALMINEIRANWFKRTVQTITYMPYFLSWVVVAGLLNTLLSPDNGAINTMIKMAGGQPVYFLTSKQWFRPILIISEIWKNIGYGSIVYLAAITSIDQEQYEAARVDGANKFQQIIHITLPALSEIIAIMLILQIGKMFDDNFDQIFNLYSPSVYEVSDVFETYVYRNGIQQSKFSYSAAVGLVKSVLALAMIVFSNKASKKLGAQGLF